MENDLFKKLCGLRVAILGDVILDRFIYGAVERISPEAPVPVLLKARDDRMLGGAANVARNVAALGGSPILLGVVGNDHHGKLVSDLLCVEERILPYIMTLDKYPTTVKTRFVCNNQQMMRVDAEQKLELDTTMIAEIQTKLRSILPTVKVLVLSDYGKGLLSREMVAMAIEAARTADVPVIVDPKANDFSLYAGASLVTPNSKEAELATGINVETDEGAAAAANAIVEKFGIAAALVTRGAHGMTLYAPREFEPAAVQRALHLPTQARQVFDVSGAGDTVIAVMALLIAGSYPIDQAAKLANIAAGIAVTKHGTAAVTTTEISSVLDDAITAHGPDLQGVTVKVAAERADAWRAEGLRVGLANGCFDLIHPGHIRLLEQAKATCDRLIVALNTDESIKRLKGDGRPLQSETMRATVMAAIRWVDVVTYFAEDTPLELIRLVRPDVLIKGADYKIGTVIGAELVNSWGGQVVLVPLEAGHSTTSITERVVSIPKSDCVE